jgi:AmmeMemoRadiSam system protein B
MVFVRFYGFSKGFRSQIFKISFLLIIFFPLMFWILSFVEETSTQASISEYYPIRFYHRDDFYHSLSFAEKQEKPRRKVVAGVIPHHLFVSNYIANFFSQRANDPPKTVILIGPNHENVGQNDIITTRKTWQTDFGMLQPDEAIIDKLVKDGVVSLASDPFENEHAIGGLTAYIKYYFRESTVVPLLFKSRTGLDEVIRLSQILSPLLDEEIFFVASVDFSHYLTAKQAEMNDEVTLKYMQSFDIEGIMKLDEQDFLDSPAAIATLFSTMQLKGISSFDILYHTNSGILSKSENTQTTSYFVINFFDKLSLIPL